MPKFTICVAVDEPDEVMLAEIWLAKWKDKVQYLSENYGCGCCVDLYDVEGTDEALSDLSKQIIAQSDWSRGVRGKTA